MHQAFVGLGGNLGDPRQAMREALHLLNEDPACRVVQVSSLYKTPPWGKLDQPDFLNAVAKVETQLSARQLLDLCLETERRLKRVRAERWGPRVIDMDILWFDNQTLDEEGLQIPHPRMAERAFVMVPLSEIAPDMMLAGARVKDLARDLDRGGIAIAAAGPDWALEEL